MLSGPLPIIDVASIFIFLHQFDGIRCYLQSPPPTTRLYHPFPNQILSSPIQWSQFPIYQQIYLLPLEMEGDVIANNQKSNCEKLSSLTVALDVKNDLQSHF